MDERQHDGEAAEDIGFLHRDPAEIVQPRQAAMFDDEVEVREIRGAMVDIGDIEGVAVERDDGRGCS
jgi:hypothetical protein